MADNKGVFSEVEQTRRNKYEIKRRDKYMLLGIVTVFAFLLSILLSKTKDFSRDFFLINFGNIRSLNDLNNFDFRIEYYIGFVIYVTILWYGLTLKKPLFEKKSIIRKIGYLIFLPFNLLFELYLIIAKKLDKNKKDDPNETLFNLIIKIGYFPINFLLFTFEETKPFKFTSCWYGKIEKDFFRQTHNKVDEILRVSELVALKDYHKIYTNEEYKHLVRLFKSEEQLTDYLKITEGYLTEKNKRKYDELFSSKNKKTLKNFRAYNGKDKVYFSMDYIIYKVSLEAKNFEDFLDSKFLKGTTRVSAEIFTYFKMIFNDKKYEYNLVGVTKEELKGNRYNKQQKAEIQNEIKLALEAKEKEDITYIQQKLKEKLIIWFKFYFSRIILQRYCNIPAGLLVVKIEDYTMRMITEVYNDKKLINISRNQNDGSSKSFNGDGLVNLFLFTFNAFLYGRKTKVLQDLEFNINTISDSASAFDDEIKEIVSNMEKEAADYNASQKNNFF